ncbi:DUF2142 domain-containing protein [Salinibacterium soli]|uniref:DUF2142 domain-containing protein n=1 Tax=Antiquaquibacter soli TaxID=3064523 RepID=A0ABT9BJD1_9MICO|nr:DUF2142 domain-containing protein [Protaetiibacter sp. WY-16]MDO7881129.1 DUF2142 domain-containing protein [Protaetiibacter sp. WY-16]
MPRATSTPAPSTTPARASRPLAVFAVVTVAMSLLSALWALATPLAGAPDEPAHAIQAAAVVRGQVAGAATIDGSSVQVPQYVAWMHAQTCYAMNADATAACIPPVPGDPSAIVASATTAGLYNPIYYVLVGWPSLIFSDSTGIYAMRIVSGLVSSVFLGLAAAVIASWRSVRLPVVAGAAAVTPMVLFLGGSVNPNTLEITATLAAFVAMLSIVASPDRSLLLQRAIILTVSASIAANVRGLSVLWVAVALLVPLVFLRRGQLRELLRSRPIQIAIGVTALAAAFGAAWVLLTGSLTPQAIPNPDRPTAPLLGESPLVGFVTMLARGGGNLQEMIGIFGWLDTFAPDEVYLIWSVLIGSLVAWSFIILRGRALLVVAALAAATVLLPAFVQAAFITSGGWIWQGRYGLPLLVMLLVGAGFVLSERAERLSETALRRMLALVLAAWAVGQTLAFVGALHRYTVGDSGSWVDVVLAPAWAPPGGALLLTALVAVTATAFAVAGYWFARGAGSHPALRD